MLRVRRGAHELDQRSHPDYLPTLPLLVMVDPRNHECLTARNPDRRCLHKKRRPKSRPEFSQTHRQGTSDLGMAKIYVA